MATEYMVRPVVRYFVTRFEDGRSQGAAWNTGSSYLGTFDNVEQANRVADAMARVDPDPTAAAKLLSPDHATLLGDAALSTCGAQLGN